MRMVFFGSGEFGCPSLRWLSGCPYELVEVVTQPARPAGRGKKLLATPIAILAAECQLPCRESENINTPDFFEHIKSLQPDVLMVIAFGQKIGTDYLRLPSCRVINLHGSLLPKYRGAAPINWAIMNGEKETGLTVIELNEVWDGGDILGKIAAEIGPNETASELHDRLAELGPAVIAEVLDKIDKGVDQPIQQDSTQATKAPKLHKSMAAIDWNQPAEKIRNQIHGMWSWPGAFCYWQPGGKDTPVRLTIARAEVVGPQHDRQKNQAGFINGDMYIVCGQGELRLLEVKPDNGRLMTFEDFVNGRHVMAGESFLNG